jgi:chromosomal replication initiation ATPase DnaA
MQATLPFVSENTYEDDDFVVSVCNMEAFRVITHPELWLGGVVMIIGDEGSGKSHLGRIFANRCDAVYADPSLGLLGLPEKDFIVEDIDKSCDEIALFHLLNHARTHGLKVLMTMGSYPRFKISDLQSRINAAHKVLIKRPTDDLLKIILIKRFSDLQLRVGQEVLDYIFTRSRRSFGYIKRLVAAIDHLSLTQKREITVPLVREVLQKYMPENLDEET